MSKSKPTHNTEVRELTADELNLVVGGSQMSHEGKKSVIQNLRA
jgi:hypothetical protein